ncbi:MAG: response regulator [Gemmatimonadales bacterium]
MRPARIRVLLADDHPLVRSGIRRVLEAQPRFEIVGEAADGGEALAKIRELWPDVLILDLAMPGKDGLEVLRHAKTIRPSLKIVVLTMHANPEYVGRAIQLGADGYLLKESAVPELLSAIEAVLAGQAFHSPRVQAELAGLVRNSAPSPLRAIDRLTEREREVLCQIAAGRSTKEVAAQLGIGRRTVETHRSNLMRKLGLHSVALLTQFAIREGLVRAP